MQDLILSASQSVIEDMKSENEVLALDQARDFSSQIVDVKHHLSELVAQHAALSDRINRLVEVSTETRDEDKYQNAQKNGHSRKTQNAHRLKVIMFTPAVLQLWGSAALNRRPVDGSPWRLLGHHCHIQPSA